MIYYHKNNIYKMVIYKIENIINNKIYIGQTIKFKERINSHFNKKKNSKYSIYSLKHAIVNEPRDNFKISIIKECENEKELLEYEKYFISLYDSTNPEKGYNLNIGGKCGNKYSEDYRTEISKKSKESKPICQYDMDGNLINEFHSVNYACRILNIDPRKIFRILSGLRKTTNGFYFEYKGKELSFKKVKTKIIYVYNKKDNTFIKKFISIKNACEELNLNRYSVGKCLRNIKKGKLAYNKQYRFSYNKLNNK